MTHPTMEGFLNYIKDRRLVTFRRLTEPKVRCPNTVCGRQYCQLLHASAGVKRPRDTGAGTSCKLTQG